MKRKRLGQHFLRSQKIVERMIAASDITGTDNVLEIGPGTGALTDALCRKAGTVTAIEADRALYENLKSSLQHDNLTILYGDGFKTGVKFDIMVSSLPYSYSRRAITWLAAQKFSHAVLIVQSEFAEKLQTRGINRRAISVIASSAFCISTICKVPMECFEPAPEVDSAMIKLHQMRQMSGEVSGAINLLFSSRRKTLRGALRKFGIVSESTERLENIASEEIVKIAESIQ